MRCSASLFVSIFGLNLMHTVMFTVLGFLLFFFLPFFFGLLPRWVCLGCVAQIAFGRKDVFFLCGSVEIALFGMWVFFCCPKYVWLLWLIIMWAEKIGKKEKKKGNEEALWPMGVSNMLKMITILSVK